MLYNASQPHFCMSAGGYFQQILRYGVYKFKVIMTDENKTHNLFITMKSGINESIDEVCVIFEQKQIGIIVHSDQSELRLCVT